MIVHDLKGRLEQLWEEAYLSIKRSGRKLRSPWSWICACARKQDALYYCSHNRKAKNTAPILIAFDVDPKSHGVSTSSPPKLRT